MVIPLQTDSADLADLHGAWAARAGFVSCELGLVSGEQVRTAGILLAAFVSPPQLLAAAVAFLARDTGIAAILGLFAASWLALGAVDIAGPTVLTSPAVGLFLAAFALVLVPLVVAGFFGKALLGAVLTVSVLRAALAVLLVRRRGGAREALDQDVAGQQHDPLPQDPGVRRNSEHSPRCFDAAAERGASQGPWAFAAPEVPLEGGQGEGGRPSDG
ncbi:hypothetical protein [Streptacidiphilus rugosus]|uniref:hypothetical protein n=1 Tax=Streptacidiphilus rugosus TaxID=405783 RepID=UPI00068C3AC8|nr:hypothetical protein [Streptacidiphilus rugosus]